MNYLRYLTLRVALSYNVPYWAAREAVATTAIEHPEWDTTTEKTFADWYAEDNRGMME